MSRAKIRPGSLARTTFPCGDCGEPVVDGRIFHVAGCSREPSARLFSPAVLRSLIEDLPDPGGRPPAPPKPDPVMDLPDPRTLPVSYDPFGRVVRPRPPACSECGVERVDGRIEHDARCRHGIRQRYSNSRRI